MNVTCEFCNKFLSSRNVLIAHQKKAKYCLSIQGKKSNFICIYCNKDFYNTYNLNDHIKIKHNTKEDNSILISSRLKEMSEELNREKLNGTIEKLKDRLSILEKIIVDKEKNIIDLENNIDNYKKTISDQCDKIFRLENTIEDLAKQGIGALRDIGITSINKSTITNITSNTKTSTKTNNINNILMKMDPLTKDSFASSTKYLTKEHVDGGSVGLASFAVDHPLHNKVVCRDSSRHIFSYKTEDGNIVTDHGGHKIIGDLLESIAPIAINFIIDGVSTEYNNETILESQKMILALKNTDGKNANELRSDISKELAYKMTVDCHALTEN